MLKQKRIPLMVTILALILLLGLSGYLAVETFAKYRINKTINNIFENVNILHDYEKEILDEALCMTLVSDTNESDKTSNICKERSTQSSASLKEIKEVDINVAQQEQKILLLKDNILKSNMENIELILGNPNDDFSVKSYLEKSNIDINDNKDKELLQLYVSLSKVSYATELESFLLTYYLTKKIPIPISNIIFWDKLVEASYLPDFESEIDNIALKEKLLKLSSDHKFTELTTKIDDMRISILSGNMLYDSKNGEWITLLENKQTSINSMRSIVYTELLNGSKYKTAKILWELLVYVALLLLALLALFYTYAKIKNEKNENLALINVLHKINALTAYGSTESDVMHKLLEGAKSKEDIFAYIYSSFQVVHDKSKKVEDDIESKSLFLSTLSHEIRTPLNGIIGFSKLLKEMGVTVDQEEFLSLIEGSSHKLIMIVNDILDLSKIDADKMSIENTSFDIFEMIESTVAIFIHETDQKDIELGVFIDPFLPRYFFGDATKLSQILINLIGNAIKFTEPYGKINIFVQSLENKEDKSQIKFAVNDTGIGLSEEQISDIFNAFSQATKNTGNAYGGTGLGLTISRKMVELMGGKLDVKSKPNQGASFYFTLTLQKDNEKTYVEYPDFTGLSVGMALPVKNIKRQLDTNIEVYMRHLGAEFSIHYYEDLFEGMGFINLPDIMIFDHHYARLSGELEQCASLDCKTVLLTNGLLRSRINPEEHHFDDVVLTPMSIRKCIRILNTEKIEKSIEEYMEEPTEAVVYETQTKIFENVESFSDLRVLVADDNLINRKLIKIILEKLGLNVTLVANGQEACEEYQLASYDIIFMDIEMPVMNGVDATHCILEYENKSGLTHVPIIALTANVATGDKERYIAEGMDDYTTKPVEIDMIKSIISKYCNPDDTSKDKDK